MKRKTQSTTILKANLTGVKYAKIVKYPHEIAKTKLNKLKLGVINPESTFQDPFQTVEGIQLHLNSNRLSLNSSFKKHPYKPFPQRHLQSVFEYSQSENQEPKDLDQETMIAQEVGWKKSTKQLSNTQVYQYFFRNMPPANYFTTENQRKIICQVFDYLEDIMDNQRFSVRLKRILKERECQIETQKRYKRFKRRKQKEVIEKIKSSSGSDNDLTLTKNYKLADLWEILKENLFKLNKMTQISIETEELSCEEFVQFINDVGFENQNILKVFFEEMKTMRVGRQQSLSKNSSDQNQFIIKIRLFMVNFQKYMDNNEKIMYLHSQNAVYMRNVSLKNYINLWHKSFQQIRQKLKQKKIQEYACFRFLKEVKENNEDEIVFELEDLLQERYNQLQKPKSSYKEVEVHNEAIKLLQEQLDKAHQHIQEVYDGIVDKMQDFVDQRNTFYIQKKLFCNLLNNIDILPGVDEFIAYIDENLFELKSNKETVSNFCQSFIDDKDTFNEFNVNLVEIADFLFSQNYGQEQTKIISKLVEQIRKLFRKQKNLTENIEIKGVQLIHMSIFEAAHQAVTDKYEIKIDFLESMKEKVIQLHEKYLNKISINQKKNAEMNFLYEYLLKQFNTIDSKMELQNKGLSNICRYLEEEEFKDTQDFLGLNEEDIDERFHNLLESMVFEVYKQIGEDIPNHLAFMIDTRTQKYKEFLEILVTKKTTISFDIQKNGDKDGNLQVEEEEDYKKNKLKDRYKSKVFQSQKESQVAQKAVKNQSELSQKEEKNVINNNSEDDFLLGIFGKQQTDKKQGIIENEDMKSPLSNNINNDFSSVKKYSNANLITNNIYLTDAKDMHKHQVQQMKQNQDKQVQQQLENQNPSTVSNNQFKYCNYNEEEQEAEKILKSIKNSSLIKKSVSNTSLNRVANRFEQYKVKMPPEYYGIHKMKDENEYRAFLDTKHIKFSPDIDKKVLQFQIDVELDEAKKKLRQEKL
ncbi:hypothetical protein ABPG72_003882 [Tetrahymena utriculariae]